MEKLIYLLGDTEAGTIPRAKAALRDTLLETGSALSAAGAVGNVGAHGEAL